MNAHPLYDEKILLSQVTQGDQAAFGILFNTYHQKVGAYILRLTESFPLTEEIVQDVFLSIWQHRAGLANVHRFEPYLFVIARNKAFNCLKQLAREQTRQREWAYSRLGAAAMDEKPDDSYGYDVLIEKAVDKLPPQQKKVYFLHNQEGLGYAAIAARLGLSATTVKKHMSLAVRNIRAYVHSHMDPVVLIVMMMSLLFSFH